MQHLLGQIREAIREGGLSDYSIGRLGWCIEELEDARKKRDHARVTELENRLDAEDPGYDEIEADVDDLHGDDDVIEAHAVSDTGWQPVSPLPGLARMANALGVPALAIEGPPALRPARRNPALEWRNRLDNSHAAPSGSRQAARSLPPESAHVAAPLLQDVPRRAAPNGDAISAAQAAGLVGAELVAVALGRSPYSAYAPPAGALVRTPRRIAAWRG